MSEADIAKGIREMIDWEHMLVEGAAAVAVAAALNCEEHVRTMKRIAIVLCGSNIGVHTLTRVLAR